MKHSKSINRKIANSCKQYWKNLTSDEYAKKCAISKLINKTKKSYNFVVTNYIKSITGKTYNQIYGKRKSDSIKQKISVFQKGKTWEELYGIDKAKYLKVNRRKMFDYSKITGAKNGFYGKKHTLESLKKIRNSTNCRPTSYEKKIIYLINKYKINLRYTGNGNFWMTYKNKHINPDFVCINNKIALEVYSNYHHKANYEYTRGQIINKCGWSAIFLSEVELFRNDWETYCLNKINKYIN